MYVKLIDGKIENAPKVLRDDKNTYANPLPETLEKFGYKVLVETECPNEEGYTYTFEYNEKEDQVVKTWVAHEIVIEPESEPEIIPEPEVIEENESEESGEPAETEENTEEEPVVE